MKNIIKNYLLRHLLNPVMVEDVITQDKTNKIYLGGKLVSEDRLRQWQAEIKAIEGSDVWKCAEESLRFQAQDKIFNISTKFEDVVAGKLMLYNLEVIDSVFRVIKNRQLK